MSFSKEQIASLTAKLDPAHVKTNPKGHDYIEGWFAIAEANRIFGHDGWDRQLLSLVQVAEPYQQQNGNWRVAYRATVRVTVVTVSDGEREVFRDGTGYGSGINKDLNDAHESAIKEAETDAMKRALMTFGNPFGLALYDKERVNVGVDEAPAIEAIKKEARGRWSVATSKEDIDAVWRGLQPEIRKLSQEGKAEMVKFFSDRAAEFKKGAA